MNLPPHDAFGPADLRLLDAIRLHDRSLRVLLCTVARHGVALRLSAPARAQAWLDQLASHPYFKGGQSYFKGGQFVFDLLEWEDFMLDGDAPPLLDADAAGAALDRIAQGLRSIAAAIDAEQVATVHAIFGARADEDLPPLESGFYLFHDVVLGAIALIAGRSGG
jgi:hypothetical protein